MHVELLLYMHMCLLTHPEPTKAFVLTHTTALVATLLFCLDGVECLGALWQVPSPPLALWESSQQDLWEGRGSVAGLEGLAGRMLVWC